MKNKVSLLVVAVLVVIIAAVAVGCSCGEKGDKETKLNPNNVSTDNASGNQNGVNVVNDEFQTISPTEKSTDKKGNTVISYTDSDGNKVTRTLTKDGKVKIVITDKNGKVIKKKVYKDKMAETKKQGKKDSKKDGKKDDKKDEEEQVGAINNDEGWSDFY